MAADRWALDWTAVASIATAVLALFTAWLAFTTRRLARATSSDVKAAWRPTLIGAASGADGTSELAVEPRVAPPETADLKLFISNVGTGPALNVEITPRSHGEPTEGQRSIGTIGPGPKNQHVVQAFDCQPMNIVGYLSYEFCVTYEDLAKTRYASKLTYDMPLGPEPYDKPFRLRLRDTELTEPSKRDWKRTRLLREG